MTDLVNIREIKLNDDQQVVKRHNHKRTGIVGILTNITELLFVLRTSIKYRDEKSKPN